MTEQRSIKEELSKRQRTLYNKQYAILENQRLQGKGPKEGLLIKDYNPVDVFNIWKSAGYIGDSGTNSLSPHGVTTEITGADGNDLLTGSPPYVVRISSNKPVVVFNAR